MDYQCNHILTKGDNKGERCKKTAWFPFFYRCFCKQHAALIYNVPITSIEVQFVYKRPKKISHKINKWMKKKCHGMIILKRWYWYQLKNQHVKDYKLDVF